MKASRIPGGYRSGELARKAGVSVDTLRHYERRGLLPAPKRLSNGYRLYAPEALERVLLVQCALSLGFTLAELSAFLGARGGGRLPCREVHRTAIERLHELDQRIEEMTRFRKNLRSLVGRWEARLRKTGDGRPAHLLESLAKHGASSLSALRFSRRPRKKEKP
jgi:DNA-binding transcriptional MerR regulator